MSRRERLKNKREHAQRMKKNAEKRNKEVEDQARTAANENSDDLLQAVTTRKGSLFCKELGGELKFTALSIAEQGEIKEEALRYFRRDQLQAKVDELKVLQQSEIITQEGFDKELTEARDEVRMYSFDDMPHMQVEYEREGRQVKQRVSYEQWFMATTKDGQITSVLVALRTHHPDITRQQLEHQMSADPDFFIESAEVIQEITNSLIAKKSRRRK